MTEAEFNKVKATYEAETRKYEALEVGQEVWRIINIYGDASPHAIKSVDVPNRKITVVIDGEDVVLGRWSLTCPPLYMGG